jgi:hypothetical protein
MSILCDKVISLSKDHYTNYLQYINFRDMSSVCVVFTMYKAWKQLKNDNFCAASKES